MGQVIDVAAFALRLAETDEPEVDAVLVDVLAALAAVVGADRAYVVVCYDDDSVELVHEWTSPSVVPHAPALARTPGAEFEHSYQAARRGEIFAAGDLDDLPVDAEPERRSFTALGVRAVLQVPILVAGECTGIIGVNHHETVDDWPPAFVDAMRSVGTVLAGVLMRLRTSDSRQRAADQIAATSRQRDDLLAHVSHELRTPLHAVLGYAELLALETTAPRNREAVDQILHNGRQLLALIEELLADDAGELPAAAVRPEIDAAVAALRDTAAMRQISITATDRTLASSIRISPGRLRQVLYCLLAGAVHAAEDDTELVIDSPADDIVRVRLGRARPDATAVNPLATALIAGYGRVDTRRVDHDDESGESGEPGGVEIDLTFEVGRGPGVDGERPTGQGAKP